MPRDPGYESATAMALRQAAEASSGRRCCGDSAANRVAGGRDPAAHPNWGVPARKPAGPAAASKKPQTLVEYSRAMTPKEMAAAMTPREREYGVVALKAPAVEGCERPKQTGTSPNGHVDPDHAHELLNLVPGGPPISIAIVNGGTDRRRLVVIALAPHLAGCEHDQVDLEVSLKDTEGPDQKLTLQAWPAGRAHLVANLPRARP
jgi:hypothetical protein